MTMEIFEVTQFTPLYHAAAVGLIGQLTPGLQITAEHFRNVIDSPGARMFFIADGEKIAGMLTVGIYPALSGTKAWIEDVVVDNEFRGLGLGRRLVQHAIDFAKSEGLPKLMLTSAPHRLAANGLYRAMGFELRQTNVYAFNLE